MRCGGPMGFYPTPNPRVISKKDEKPFEFYLEGEFSQLLMEVLTPYLQHVAYEWVVDYTRIHDNYLPSKQTLLFSTTEELVVCLTFCKDFNKIPQDLFLKLVAALPESGWYVHPTYPLSIAQIP